MYRVVDGFARFFALIGGAVLAALILLTCLSVIGRSINSLLHTDALQSALPELSTFLLSTGVGPINGDFEIVEAGMAFTIFAFLPLCQLHAAHATVDIFTSILPMRVNRVLRAIIEVAFAAALILIAAQLYSGMLSKFNSGQTTLLLQFPVWWSYAAGVVAAALAALVGVYTASMHVVGVVQGRSTVVSETGGNH